MTRSSFQIFEVLSGEREIRTVLCAPEGKCRATEYRVQGERVHRKAASILSSLGVLKADCSA